MQDKFLQILQKIGHRKIIRTNTSVMRQKGESQNGCFQKRKHAKFHKCVCVSAGKKGSFFGK